MRRLYYAEVIVIFAIASLMPLMISGLSPSAVMIRAEHGADFLVISWKFNANFSHYRILFRDSKSSNASDEAGPMPCVPSQNSICSFCISNINRGVSCSTLDRRYSQSIGSEMDFEKTVSVKVESCADILPKDCVAYSEWMDYTIPPGAPSPVLNVHARPLSSKRVEITWSLPDQTRGTIVLYTVFYRAQKGREKIMVFRNVTNGILTRLNAETNYTIWMTASTENKEGEKSALTTVQTYADECVSSPCKYNGRCQVDGSTFVCECIGDWDGHICSDPKGYAMKENRCLDLKCPKRSFIHFNVTLEFCAAQCKRKSNCSSFEYGLEYIVGGLFADHSEQSGLGLCRLHSTDTKTHGLLLCSYDYYEKKHQVSASITLFVPKMLFLGSFLFFTLELWCH